MFSLDRNRALVDAGEESRAYDFYVLHPSNWVNVIPLTSEGEVIFIEQYRHGIEKVTLEIPGGAIDPDDESSLHAAKRELFEETGYVSEELTFLGRNHPNPAMQSNYCDTYLATNSRQVCVPTFAGSEDIRLRIVPLSQVPQLVKAGEITHALVLVAFYMFQLVDK
ncbi:MAG TPA: NUDIX hydrolase [Candidatus Obscuribacterales bacterium]